jgi:hypothetical protein
VQVAPRRNEHVIFVLAAFLVTLGIGALFAPYTDFDLIHEALFFKPAIDLVEGKMLYRDSFTAYGALTVILQSLAIVLGGRHLVVAKYEVVLLTAFAAAYLWLIFRRFSGPWVALLSILLWNGMAYYFLHHYLEWPSAYAVFFQVQSLYFLIKGVETKRWTFFFMAGMSACGCVFSKQNVGIYLFGSEVCALLLLGVAQRARLASLARHLLSYASGFSALLGAFLIWFACNDAVRDWWLQCYKWASDWGKIYGNNYSLDTIVKALFVVTPNAAPDGIRPSYLFSLLPCLTLVIFGVRLFQLRRASPSRTIQFVTAMACLASWLQYYPINGIGQLWWAATPMVGLVLPFLFETVEWFASKLRYPRLSTPLFLSVILVLFSPILYRHFHYARHFGKLSQKTVTIPGDGLFAGLKVTPVRAEHALAIQEAVDREVNRKYSNPNVILIGVEALFISLVKNNHAFHPIWATRHMEPIHSAYPDFPEKLDRYIAKEKPILFAKRDWMGEISQKYPHYETVADVDEWFVILKPKPDR